MSSEIFEKNVGAMVRRAALRPDETHAKARFLRGLDAPEERRSWKVAAAAAAMVVVATIVASARREPPAAPAKATVGKNAPVPAGDLLPIERTGSDALKVALRISREDKLRPMLRLLGTSPLPDGLFFKVRMARMEDRFTAGRLESQAIPGPGGSCELVGGAFDFESPTDILGPLQVQVSALDDFQELAMVKKLKVKESERIWNFRFDAWTDRHRSLLGPQLAEVSTLAAEARDLVDRIEGSLETEDRFKSQQKELVKAAEQVQARALGLAQAGIYPASAREVMYAARNLATSMPIFTWAEGKFAGPKSYYTDGKVEKTYWNEPFSLEAIRRYLGAAEIVAGREFDLWILKDVRRAGLQEEHRALVREHAKRPGVAEFGDRLLTPTAGLEAEVRQVLK